MLAWRHLWVFTAVNNTKKSSICFIHDVNSDFACVLDASLVIVGVGAVLRGLRHQVLTGALRHTE
jgi:hypothetical protein